MFKNYIKIIELEIKIHDKVDFILDNEPEIPLYKSVPS